MYVKGHRVLISPVRWHNTIYIIKHNTTSSMQVCPGLLPLFLRLKSRPSVFQCALRDLNRLLSAGCKTCVMWLGNDMTWILLVDISSRKVTLSVWDPWPSSSNRCGFPSFTTNLQNASGHSVNVSVVIQPLSVTHSDMRLSGGDPTALSDFSRLPLNKTSRGVYTPL